MSMGAQVSGIQWVLGVFLLLFAIGVISLKKPLYAALSFLASLLMIGALYLTLFAEFIALMQVLVYAGAILVIFVFVIVLFQDAHAQIDQFAPKVSLIFLLSTFIVFAMAQAIFALYLRKVPVIEGASLPENFGSVSRIGEALYTQFFFPFESVVLLFLVAAIGALYIAKRESSHNA